MVVKGLICLLSNLFSRVIRDGEGDIWHKFLEFRLFSKSWLRIDCWLADSSQHPFWRSLTAFVSTVKHACSIAWKGASIGTSTAVFPAFIKTPRRLIFSPALSVASLSRIAALSDWERLITVVSVRIQIFVFQRDWNTHGLTTENNNNKNKTRTN